MQDTIESGNEIRVPTIESMQTKTTYLNYCTESRNKQTFLFWNTLAQVNLSILEYLGSQKQIKFKSRNKIPVGMGIEYQPKNLKNNFWLKVNHLEFGGGTSESWKRISAYRQTAYKTKIRMHKT